MLTRLLRSLAFLVLLGVAGAQAETFPAHQVTIIVPFAAGGPSDVIARIVADQMSKRLGQPFVIENVNGAGGTIGAIRAARAAPDGYTLVMGHMGTHAASVALYANLAYDPRTDFAPIGLVALDDEGTRKRLGDLGATIAEKSRRGPAPMAALVKSEVARLTPILQAAAQK
jgi:tripartite-type tricarboxylate transporter receptor subunit TctC